MTKMKTLSSLGIGLSLVFGFLLLALVAELYYLLWWKKKKRIASTESEEEDCRDQAKDLNFSSLLCWRRRPSSLGHGVAGGGDPDGNGGEQDLELGGAGKDLLVKAFGEEGIESELMRLHNLAGPPRFLFTIKEETKEDLETESVKSRTRRSLSDLLMAVDTTPFLTPLASPPMKHPEPSLLGSFNPLFESSVSETELVRLRSSSSPPPKFKFLRDAEEKLRRRLEEASAEKRVSENVGSVPVGQDFDHKDESSVTIIVSKNKNRDGHELQQQQQRCNLVQQKCPSSSSQVLPLASSPTPFRPLDQKHIVH